MLNCHRSKRMQEIYKKVPRGKLYPLQDSFLLLKELARANPVKFSQTVDLAVLVGVDMRKSDQIIRLSVVLPKGTGRSVKRVAVFASSVYADSASQAGADVVGLDDLVTQIKTGEFNYEAVLATPDAMRVVAQVSKNLGPKGLMPNLKDGTVTTDIANAVRNAKIGQIRLRTDKAGAVHCPLGKIDFPLEALVENFKAVLAALKKAKPNSAKGVYLKKMVLSTTMGPGLLLDISNIE